jgi:hypothetical protein
MLMSDQHERVRRANANLMAFLEEQEHLSEVLLLGGQAFIASLQTAGYDKDAALSFLKSITDTIYELEELQE